MNLLYYLFIKATSKANQKEGFTLLEVIVTMVVMALLATLAMPTIQKSYDRFR
ncbi:MAG: type II secretion system protein, partial [Peptococcaceae bacterium]|nr:type II secretion system protein [Peptococcaceae bacterium]